MSWRLKTTLLLGLALQACGGKETPPGVNPTDGGTDGGGSPAAAARPFSEALLAQLKKPAGFSVDVFARDLGSPRLMAVAPDGSVYVTRRGSGDVLRLRDADGDGRAEVTSMVAQGIDGVHGVAVQGNKLFLASTRYVFAGTLSADGSVAMPMAVVLDLPMGGEHPDRSIGFGPDGKLHISVASSCDVCVESNAEQATMLQTAADGTGRAILARGLRNSIGFGWHPTTGELWAAEEGSGPRGGTTPPDELNRITQGSHYGWPYCFGKRQVDGMIADPEGVSKDAFCRNTQSPALELGTRGSPFALAFYNGTQFPMEYRGDALVALRGNIGSAPLSGLKVIRVRFGNGQPSMVEDFVSGFAVEGGSAYFARPAGLVVAADGALLLSDDANGIIYRVSYTGS
jgi:glucose/arabinose dehydrogenase